MPRVYRGVKFQTGANKVSRSAHSAYERRKWINTPEHMRLSREQVRKQFCPTCLAKPGLHCQDRNRQPRESNHIDRVHLALEKAGKAGHPTV